FLPFILCALILLFVALPPALHSFPTRRSSDLQRGDTCLTHHLWHDLSAQIRGFLDGVTLGQLAQHREVRHIAERQLQRQHVNTGAQVDNKSRNSSRSANDTIVTSSL